jgi:hypothetical protein
MFASSSKRAILARAGRGDQGLHESGVGAGPVDRLLDRDDARVVGCAAQEVHHRRERLVRVVKEHVVLADRGEQVAAGEHRGQARLERRELQVGPVDQVDHLLQPDQVHRAVDAVAVLRAEVELLEQELQHARRDRRRHLEPHLVAVVALGQLAVQRLAQVGDLLLVDEELAVARHAELVDRAHRQAREQPVDEAADDRGQQRDRVRRARDLLRHSDHARQRARRLHDRDARPPAERIDAVELDDEVQALVQDPRERMRRVERDRRQQRLDLRLEHRLGPRALRVVPHRAQQDHDALVRERGHQRAVQQAVLARDQPPRAFGDRRQLLGDRHAVELRGRVGAHQLLQLRDAHLEELVEVVADDRQVPQPLEQGDRRVVGEREHPFVEREDAELAVQQARRARSVGRRHHQECATRA